MPFRTGDPGGPRQPDLADRHGSWLRGSLVLCAATASLSVLAICLWLRLRSPASLASPPAVG